MKTSDPTASYAEDFRQRLDRSELFYKKLAYVITADQILRDWDALYEPAAPRQGFLHRLVQMVSRPVGWVHQRLSQSRERGKATDSSKLINLESIEKDEPFLLS